MSSVWVDVALGVLLFGAGVAVLLFTHRAVAKAGPSKDDYLVPAAAGTLITSLLAGGVAYLARAALTGQMVREIAIGAVISLALLIVARVLWRRHDARARRTPPAQAMPL